MFREARRKCIVQNWSDKLVIMPSLSTQRFLKIIQPDIESNYI